MDEDMLSRRSGGGGLGLFCLAFLLAAPASAIEEGCPEAPEAPASYLARARQASATGDHSRAADELWGAWCGRRDTDVLVKICEAHLLAQECLKGEEILRYAGRRQEKLAGATQKALRLCGQRLRRACAAGGSKSQGARVERSSPPSLPVTPPPRRLQFADSGEPADPAALETGTLRLVVSGPAHGARYFIDELEYAESDMLGTQGIRLPAGRRLLVVQREDSPEFTREVDLRPNSTAVVYVPLRRREAPPASAPE